MSRIKQGVAILAVTLYSVMPLKADAWTIPLLFEEPRHSGFKVRESVGYDASNAIHLFGSAFMYNSLDRVLCNIWHDRHNAHLVAAGATIGLGVLKELEDGYREGWDNRDFACNVLGVGLTYAVNEVIDRYIGKK